MLFTEPGFLFLFLPLVLGMYYLAPRPLRNLVLLLASLYFYSVGERLFVLVMIASILFNYGMGLWIDGKEPPRSRRLLLIVGILLNLGNLATFKYAGFISTNLNSLIESLHGPTLPPAEIHLPIGISFFTFHALSYLIDVYRRDVRAMRRLDSFALYITLFPQLIAGPIIRYKLIADQFNGRRETVSSFSAGVRRFILGLGKKMIIANTVGQVADQVFAIPAPLLTPGVAWLGVACYALQIYFDFSGYSDMAIGLGRMFGFVFPENFNYPYAANSITDFWRRWHMTLSSWFRDYLYIPLGGNQRGTLRTYYNLLVVFFLCGLWHGASWTFVIWGLFHGTFLIFERMGLAQILNRLPRFLRQAYVVLVVCVGWIFFRADNFTQALGYLAALTGLTAANGEEYFVRLFLDSRLVFALVVGALGSVPILPALSRSIDRLRSGARALRGRWVSVFSATAELASLAVVFFASVMLSAAGTYNPFIYFRF